MCEEDRCYTFNAGNGGIDPLIKYWELDVEKVSKENVELLKELFKVANIYLPNYKFNELSEEVKELFKSRRVL
jgi:hypothetical protein